MDTTAAAPCVLPDVPACASGAALSVKPVTVLAIDAVHYYTKGLGPQIIRTSLFRELNKVLRTAVPPGSCCCECDGVTVSVSVSVSVCVCGVAGSRGFQRGCARDHSARLWYCDRKLGLRRVQWESGGESRDSVGGSVTSTKACAVLHIPQRGLGRQADHVCGVAVVDDARPHGERRCRVHCVPVSHRRSGRGCACRWAA